MGAAWIGASTAGGSGLTPSPLGWRHNVRAIFDLRFGISYEYPCELNKTMLIGLRDCERLSHLCSLTKKCLSLETEALDVLRKDDICPAAHTINCLCRSKPLSGEEMRLA